MERFMERFTDTQVLLVSGHGVKDGWIVGRFGITWQDDRYSCLDSKRWKTLETYSIL